MAGITPYQALGKAMIASAAVKAGNRAAAPTGHPSFDPVIAQLFPPVGVNTILLNVSHLVAPATPDRAERFADLQPLATAALIHLLAATAIQGVRPEEVATTAATLQPFRHLTAIVPEDLEDFDSLKFESFWTAAGALQMGGSISVLAGESAMQCLQGVPHAFLRLLYPHPQPVDLAEAKPSSRHSVVVGEGALQHNAALYVFTTTVRRDRDPTQDAVRVAHQMFGAPTLQPVAM